ncbi:copper resistance protein NlpE N-terminal domain-containing protein [Hymenobacter norwichensis]|uniref:copper resistance protein NlpE N-terminal domain-containing protein n=1 Tax=Hymenobacter norwichensis TaxID=223903 RepID=UPI0003B599DF|nr:copper resistance protein NlpE N-terminal domain-containing protein [Hymenobacter norwichensis]
MNRRYFVFIIGLLLSAPAVLAQRKATPAATLKPSFFTTYTYLSYSILDQESGPTPVAASGVGGTLTLRPDGTYQKHLTLTVNQNPMPFDQTGRFTFAGNHITFTYSDKKGQPRTDQGTFSLRNNLLTLVIEGYPAGNSSTYTLRAQ